MPGQTQKQRFNDAQLSVAKAIELVGLKLECEELDYKMDLDFRSPKETLELMKDVVGFSNTLGGYIVIGVNNEYELVGLQASYHFDSSEVQQRIGKYCSPDVNVKYGEFSVPAGGETKRVALLYIPESKDIVVTKIDGQFTNSNGEVVSVFKQHEVYVRSGSSTKRASESDYRSFLKSKETPLVGSDVIQVPEPKPPAMQNIPRPEYQEFVGREKYIADIVSKLQARFIIVSIDGVGGVGKTALAHQVATKCWDGRLFDAVVWVSAKSRRLILTGIDEMTPSLTSYDDLLNQIAQVLGFQSFADMPLEQKEKEVYKLLSTIKCLLVIDNLETIDDPHINNFIKELPEPTKALVTSRKRLGEVERIVHLDEMGLEETRELLRIETEAKNVEVLRHADDRTVKALHEATGGIPLAIKWVVGWVAIGTPIERVLKRLKEADSPLLEFCFRETYNNVLTENARALLSIMPIFPEPPSRPQLSAASRLVGDALDDAIAQLVTLSLLNERSREDDDGTVKTVYGILPLTLSFAQAELSKQRGLEKEARKAYGEYLQLHATMKDAALQYGYTLEDLGATTERGRAAALLANLAFAAYQRGSYKDAVNLFRRAVDTNPRLSYSFQLWAIVERQEGNFGRANELFQEAARLNPHNPMVWRAWASMKAETGMTAEALKLAQEGVNENPQDKGVLHNLAVNESKAGNYERADKLFDNCLYGSPTGYREIRQNIVTFGAKAENLRRWGVNKESKVELDVARSLYLKGLEAVRQGLNLSESEWKLHEIQIRLNRNLGELELKAGDLDKADLYLQRALFYRPRDATQLRHNSEVYLAMAKVVRDLGLADKAMEIADVGLRDWEGNFELRGLREQLARERGSKRK